MPGIHLGKRVGRSRGQRWSWVNYYLRSGTIWYKRETSLSGGYFKLWYSDDSGVTWEELLSLDVTESEPVIDLAHEYRHRIVDYEYRVDRTLTATGYAGTEGVDWENIGMHSGGIVYSDNYGTSAANTAYENTTILNSLIADSSVTKIIIGRDPTDVYLISQPISPNSGVDIEYNCILKIMDSVTDALAQNILEDATTFTATDASKFHVGEFVAVTDDDQFAFYGKLRGWGGKITDITGNVITLNTAAPYAYTAASNGTIATLQPK